MSSISITQELPVRAYIISSKIDASGYYQKVPIRSKDIIAEFGIDSLNDAPALRDYFFCSGRLYQIDDDLFDDAGQGCVRFDDNNTIKITDIREKINSNMDTEYFIIADQTCTDFVWAVVEPCEASCKDRTGTIVKTIHL